MDLCEMFVREAFEATFITIFEESVTEI